ncbi:hypothetical protein P171DRAFT_148151 [Karstenula rhodostoma CBS 690.94]|uniref:Uncharacterized protein n=1 Tax=Karstenula rhodostoma CBS 690.94 TaxID=1392251 RepID=A0A9P4PT48_9PLEO|nr:hypothetical protein P171DRAFT_148151 [Karstenula rhodostoma CBS 690.94]
MWVLWTMKERTERSRSVYGLLLCRVNVSCHLHCAVCCKVLVCSRDANDIGLVPVENEVVSRQLVDQAPRP